MSVQPVWTRPALGNSRHGDLIAFSQDFWPSFITGVVSSSGVVSGWRCVYSAYNADDTVATRHYRNNLDQVIAYNMYYTGVGTHLIDRAEFYWWDKRLNAWTGFNPGRVTFVWSGDIMQTYTWGPLT